MPVSSDQRQAASLNHTGVLFALLPRPQAQLVGRRAIISIVDDDASVRNAIKRLVQSAGLNAEDFASAEEFLTSSRSQDSACLILDLGLPGMSGMELQSQLLISNPRLPIVFISAHADEVTRARALCAGATDFLPKPFSQEALFAAIDTSLSCYRSGGFGRLAALSVSR